MARTIEQQLRDALRSDHEAGAAWPSLRATDAAKRMAPPDVLFLLEELKDSGAMRFESRYTGDLVDASVRESGSRDYQDDPRGR